MSVPFRPSPRSSPSPVVPPPPVPDGREVPRFAPVRVRGGWYRSGRLARHRRRAVAAGLAVTAAALVAAAPEETDRARGHPAAGSERRHRAVALVSAPVRIADGATVGLLRPGDRVDVIAAPRTQAPAAADGGTGAWVVARGARVTRVPDPVAGESDGGALIVVSVPRPTAVRLAGAGATARLAVTLC